MAKRICLPILLTIILFLPKISQAASGVVINEIMIKPESGQSEWIELFNMGDSPISLDGYWLDDDDTLMVSGAVQKGSEDPGSDPKALSGEIQGKQYKAVTFSSYLNDTGDVPTLFSVVENNESKLDSYSYTDNPGVNVTYGRIPDGAGDWQKCSPTYEAPNANCQDNSPQSQTSQEDLNENLDTTTLVSKSPTPSSNKTSTSPKPSPQKSPTSQKSQVLGQKQQVQPQTSTQTGSSPSPSLTPQTPEDTSKSPTKLKLAAIFAGSGLTLIGATTAGYLWYHRRRSQSNQNQ